MSNNYDVILTAHHADDNIETLLMNIIRGTGIEGLTGIPEQNGRILRPLLPFYKSEIIAYAQTHQIPEIRALISANGFKQKARR